MPTGVTLTNPRERLFEAAERVLTRDGPNALTSRAVTAEAGVAKGVLHKHFPDFDSFLQELVQARRADIEMQGAMLLNQVGTGTVAGNVTGALLAAFGPLTRAILVLVMSRESLRRPPGLPLLTEATKMIAAYLAAEPRFGRDPGTTALALVGTAHLLFAGRENSPLDVDELGNAVASLV